MTDTAVKRRLAAIMAADMVGYSRLVRSDETGTLARQKGILREVVDPLIAAHDGHLVKTTGDGFLAEFPSVVAALTCAASIQTELAAREADTPEEIRIEYRIGLNVGEVIFDDGDIFGDGVNVAARLEGLADPGGVLISDAVFQTVQGKLDLGFEDIGAQQVKNISEPVRAYRVLLDPEDAGLFLDSSASPRRRRWPLMLAVAVLVGALVAVAGLFPRETPPARPPEPQAIRLLVLPYATANADSDTDADAISENLWLTLPRLRGATMVPREAALTLRGIDPTRTDIRARRCHAPAERHCQHLERTGHDFEPPAHHRRRTGLAAGKYGSRGRAAGDTGPAQDGRDLCPEHPAQRNRTGDPRRSLHRQPSGISRLCSRHQPAALLSLEQLSRSPAPFRSRNRRRSSIRRRSGGVCPDQL